MGGFLASLFGGQNKTLNKDIDATGGIAGFATGAGESATTTGLNFDKSLIGGDQSAITKLLAPQIGSIQKQGQQKKQTLSQFGNRSGGTNASSQAAGDVTSASINDMIAKLTGGAVDATTSAGMSLLGQGAAAYGQQAGLSQQRMQNYQNSLFGGALQGGLDLAEGAAGKGLGLKGF